MSVIIRTRTVGPVTVVDVTGRLAGYGPAELRDNLRDLLAAGQKMILLNMSEVSYTNSAGIGELIAGYSITTNAGGELKLLNFTKRVKDLLQITNLYVVFDVHDDEGAAIRSFSKK